MATRPAAIQTTAAPLLKYSLYEKDEKGEIEWNYILDEDICIKTNIDKNITGITAIYPVISNFKPGVRGKLTPAGELIIYEDYAWDGSDAAPDTVFCMFASLVHDIFCQIQAIEETKAKKGKALLDKKQRNKMRLKADELYEQLCISDGMSKSRARGRYRGIRFYVNCIRWFWPSAREKSNEWLGKKGIREKRIVTANKSRSCEGFPPKITYWRIRSNPEELDMLHDKKMEKCLDDNKIYVGVPSTLPAFKERVSIGDYFVTKNKDRTYYVGKITGNCQEHAINNLHYRKVEWLNNGCPVNGADRFLPQQYMSTCTEITGGDADDFQDFIKRTLK